MNQDMIEKQRGENPRGRAVSVHLVVHAWVHQDITAENAGLGVYSMHVNRLPVDLGMGWLGTDIRRVVDHGRDHQALKQMNLWEG
jgi:hypothetical protein